MRTMNPIDFYFDFSSPYGYLASQKIEALAEKHGRTVDWHPMLLGVVFKQTGAAPLTEVPVKGPYSKHDFWIRFKCHRSNTITCSRRMHPISRSTTPFCHGLAGAVTTCSTLRLASVSFTALPYTRSRSRTR